MFLQVCPVCEHRNPRGSRFCNECGSPLQLRFCPHCHAAEDVMALECGTCGERLPMLVLTDTTIPPHTLPPPPDTLWQTRAPQPAPFESPINGFPVDGADRTIEDTLTTVSVPGLFLDRGEAAKAPFGDGTAAAVTPTAPGSPLDDPAATASPPATAQPATAAAAAWSEPLMTVLPDPDATLLARPASSALAELATGADGGSPAPTGSPTSSAVTSTTTSPGRGPSIIERLNASAPKFEFLAGGATTTATAAATGVDQGAGTQIDMPVAPTDAAVLPGADTSPDSVEPAQPLSAVASTAINAPAIDQAATAIAAPGTDATPRVLSAQVASPVQSFDMALVLQAETESEIAVSAEAETLVEASFGPVTYEPPVEITVPDTTQIDAITSQLRQGVWRHALPIETMPMPPAVIRVEPPVKRRLSLQRVGLAVGSVSAVAAAILLVRLTPGPSAPTPSTSAAAAQGAPAEANRTPPASAAPTVTAARAPVPGQGAATAGAVPAASAANVAPATTASPAVAPAATTSTVLTTVSAATTAPAAKAAAAATAAQANSAPAGDSPASATTMNALAAGPDTATLSAANAAAPSVSAALGAAAMPAVARTQTVDPAPAAPLAGSGDLNRDRRETRPAPTPIERADTAPDARTTTAAKRPTVARGTAADASATSTRSARATAFEPPRTCTAAIAALGLCTLDAGQEGH